MKYTLEEYRDRFFNGKQSAMMHYWGKEARQYADWKKANSFFIVVGGEHIRASEKNIVTFDEGVK